MTATETIEILRPEDKQAIEFCANYISIAWNKDLGEARSRMYGYARRENIEVCIIAKINSIPIGMIMLFLRDGIGKSEPWSAGLTAGLYVIEQYRHNGIGRHLLEVVKQQAILEGLERIHLSTDKEILKQWYQRLGWKNTGEVHIGNRSYDAFQFDLKRE